MGVGGYWSWEWDRVIQGGGGWVLELGTGLMYRVIAVGVG